jgi:hypothetical protein
MLLLPLLCPPTLVLVMLAACCNAEPLAPPMRIPAMLPTIESA